MTQRQWQGLITASCVDGLIAVGLFAWAAPDVPWWWRPASHVPATPVVFGYIILAFAMSAPFLWRRRFPATVFLLCVAVLGVRAASHQNVISAFAAVLVAAYGLGAYGATTRRYARGLGWCSLVAAVLADMARNGNGRLSAVPFALLGAAFLMGDAATARRNELASAVDGAHRDERARIARELHDVVAHQLSAIAVQAGVARLAAQGPQPPMARAERAPSSHAAETSPGSRSLSSVEVLETVEQLAREALGELSHLLGVLRHETDDSPSRRPAPTLAELDTLLDTSRAAGVPVDLAIIGRPRDLTPGLELSAYRIIQESLVNVAKHAPGAPSLVAMTYRDDHLELRISNERSPLLPYDHAEPIGSQPPFPGGRGLVGMRERAELYDGTCCASARRDGGFEIVASLFYVRTAGVR